ncbi:ParB N-terminal domain-containing protein [Geomonas edaphica]|uniref:ParB N-terminal domain-containing protein n=1 Tax=Geomonas edaphica TaxID=2570226 RepID=UPI0010A84284|nr:ParB N-terminal domain-containing protein [Geomonas edaphica]
MERKLRRKRKFIPCAVDDGDELYPNGIFVFNITKMTEYIKGSNIPCEEVMVKDFPRGTSKFKEEYLATVDVTRPVIVAEISPGRFNVIDGNHRMERARRLGLEKISAFRVSPEQHLQFVTTERGYQAYIGYWNGKLKDSRR